MMKGLRLISSTAALSPCQVFYLIFLQRTAKSVQPCPLPVWALLRPPQGLRSLTHWQEADQLIIVRHAQDTGHLAADGILVGDMAFNSAALIAQRHNS